MKWQWKWLYNCGQKCQIVAYLYSPHTKTSCGQALALTRLNLTGHHCISLLASSCFMTTDVPDLANDGKMKRREKQWTESKDTEYLKLLTHRV